MRRHMKSVFISKPKDTFEVVICWNDTAKVWFVDSSEFDFETSPIEAETQDLLIEKLQEIAEGLLPSHNDNCRLNIYWEM